MKMTRPPPPRTTTRPTTETPHHLLYVLLDSNLPTGGFVASSGLESYAKHGFLRPVKSGSSTDMNPSTFTTTSSTREWAQDTARPNSAPSLSPLAMASSLMSFANAEISNYQSTTGWYLDQSHQIVHSIVHHLDFKPPDDLSLQIKAIVQSLIDLDSQHESTLLSHVARRASRTQGIALLTLYARGLSRPPGFENHIGLQVGHPEVLANSIVNEYKTVIRKGSCPGHLAVCWGVITGALGLDLDTARHLYLFTHARSLLSAAVRLNLIGPYLSTQLLSHPMREIIDEICASSSSSSLKPKSTPRPTSFYQAATKPHEDEVDATWDWADKAETGPATTWPLGEILAARHDMQHSRIFNS